MESCGRWSGLHKQPDLDPFKWLGMKQHSQKVVSITGNSFRNVGKPSFVTMLSSWLRERLWCAELSSKQQAATSKNERQQNSLPSFGIFYLLNDSIWVPWSPPPQIIFINIMYIFYRPHGVWFDILVFNLSAATTAHLKMLSCVWCLKPDRDAITLSDISMHAFDRNEI